ncbi:HAD family hydrolase [Rubrivirga sp. IMCC45206]|uniref:sulfotransferase-like domain-containing protein n=1 Tax=Rubrivirga sp. IMCC45206 TaxID=3391614 RepID=UPI00398FD34C
MADPVRLAMWNGPRCRSTALLRAWQSRADTVGVDEPLYGVYLAHTDVDHPARASVLAEYATDWRDVVAELTGPAPGGAPIWYQKHMAHHLLPHVGRDWLDDGFRHAFLIRDPAALVVSLAKVIPEPGLLDTGLPQQVELFERFSASGPTPPVVDADDLLRAPGLVLAALSDRLGVAFDPAMLAWAPGRRDTDKTWTEHWYASVWRSTGFGRHELREVVVPDALRPLVEEADELYARLRPHSLRVDRGPGTEDRSGDGPYREVS